MPLFGANVESSWPFPDTCNPLMVLGLPDVDSVSTTFYTQSSTWLREATGTNPTRRTVYRSPALRVRASEFPSSELPAVRRLEVRDRARHHVHFGTASRCDSGCVRRRLGTASARVLIAMTMR